MEMKYRVPLTDAVVEEEAPLLVSCTKVKKRKLASVLFLIDL